MSPKVLSEFKGIFERGRHMDWKLFVGKVRVYEKDYTNMLQILKPANFHIC